MSSDVEIANMALTHIGVGREIASFTEQSEEARALNRVYVPFRQRLLRAIPWPFATAFSAAGGLPVVKKQPTTEWQYSYRVPGDCLMVRRVMGVQRTDSRQTRIPYRLGTDGQGPLLFCDQPNAQIEYTYDVTNSAMFPSDFTMMLSLGAGVLVVPRLAKGDPFGLGKRALSMFNQEFSKAAADAINEEQSDLPTESEFVRARDGLTGWLNRGDIWSALPASQLIE